LAAGHVDCIVPDSRGFIWFCTPEGLTRFDGYRLVNVSARLGFPDRAIRAFLETRSSQYLVGTNRGLSMFDSKAGRGFITYRQGVGVFDKPIDVLMESRTGTIWCGAAGRLMEASRAGTLGPPKWAAPERVSITDIKEDIAGKLWVATNGGIYVIPGVHTSAHSDAFFRNLIWLAARVPRRVKCPVDRPSKRPLLFHHQCPWC
jgi:ligand-binding sensor domain-containing protein